MFSINDCVVWIASSVFAPVNNCPNATFGINCSSSENICNIAQPCFNSGTCIENKTITYGYVCECAWGFQGINCENDQRPCQPFTCFGRGKFNKENFDDKIYYYLGNCSNKTNSSTEFECHCDLGYEGEQCEKTVNFCANVICQNRGVCFQQFLNYTCNCLLGFNGRHCEITETSTVVRGYVTKSNFIWIYLLKLFFFCI
jgi:Notch-like protein